MATDSKPRAGAAAPILAEPLVVLDDDPTGAQTLAGVRVLLAWDAARIRRALAHSRAVHLLTNARALAPGRVAATIASAASAARAASRSAHVVLRGDSTLRGHLLEEVTGLREALAPGAEPPLLLVPALPSAGRVTVGGVHLLEREGKRVPLHETEYAHDGLFAYRDARLLAWAEERTGGRYAAAAGRELPLAQLRAHGGAERVAAILAELAAAGRPAAFAPDAETDGDLARVAEGYVLAAEGGVRSLVRSAPAFVGVLSGTAAPGLVAAPAAKAGVLVVCGSYVPTTTRQLARLAAVHPGALVEADVGLLASSRPEREIERLARRVRELLARRRLAVVATPRERPAGLRSLEAGERIAHNLAAVVAALDPPPGVVVAKGGITSHVTLAEGIGAAEAEVLGPVLPGVSRWRIPDTGLEYVVVPGNVGDDDLLAELVALILER